MEFTGMVSYFLAGRVNGFLIKFLITFHRLAVRPAVRGRNPLQKMVKIARSRYAGHVRHLETGYSGSASPGQDIQDLAGLLSPCLGQLTDLRVLRFRASCDSLPREQEGIAIRAIITALRYVVLPRLEGLELFLPIAHDFRFFFPSHCTPLQIPMEDILRGLKYLALHVTAYTTEDGQRYWVTPVLPAHAALPNDIHAAQLLRLVELAPNLSALQIRSTDILPFHPIHFSPSLRLTSLCLARVVITLDHFHALTTQCREHLRHIELSLVKLHSGGTWHALLTHLAAQLPRLVDVVIDSCGYPATGPNAHLASILPEPDDPRALETINFADYGGLDALRDRVNANRVASGLEPRERTDYRWR
ncbi:hypothetical protein BJY00DRAFT_306601 [Aspergillus carlsbadensis]|nr:hypothetical protein BJY00DRAFT_306601 [Aspergillus carlsbadensis]